MGVFVVTSRRPCPEPVLDMQCLSPLAVYDIETNTIKGAFDEQNNKWLRQRTHLMTVTAIGSE